MHGMPRQSASRLKPAIGFRTRLRNLKPDLHTSDVAESGKVSYSLRESLTSSHHRFTNHSRGQGHQDHV